MSKRNQVNADPLEVLKRKDTFTRFTVPNAVLALYEDENVAAAAIASLKPNQSSIMAVALLTLAEFMKTFKVLIDGRVTRDDGRSVVFETNVPLYLSTYSAAGNYGNQKVGSFPVDQLPKTKGAMPVMPLDAAAADTIRESVKEGVVAQFGPQCTFTYEQLYALQWVAQWRVTFLVQCALVINLVNEYNQNPNTKNGPFYKTYTQTRSLFAKLDAVKKTNADFKKPETWKREVFDELFIQLHTRAIWQETQPGSYHAVAAALDGEKAFVDDGNTKPPMLLSLKYYPIGSTFVNGKRVGGNVPTPPSLAAEVFDATNITEKQQEDLQAYLRESQMHLAGPKVFVVQNGRIVPMPNDSTTLGPVPRNARRIVAQTRFQIKCVEGGTKLTLTHNLASILLLQCETAATQQTPQFAAAPYADTVGIDMPSAYPDLIE